jgi:hypothetical protein
VPAMEQKNKKRLHQKLKTIAFKITNQTIPKFTKIQNPEVYLE